jgi:hypothetical protein
MTSVNKNIVGIISLYLFKNDLKLKKGKKIPKYNFLERFKKFKKKKKERGKNTSKKVIKDALNYIYFCLLIQSNLLFLRNSSPGYFSSSLLLRYL